MHHIGIPGLSISQWKLAHDVTKLFRDFQTKIALWDGNAVNMPYRLHTYRHTEHEQPLKLIVVTAT